MCSVEGSTVLGRWLFLVDFSGSDSCGVSIHRMADFEQ